MTKRYTIAMGLIAWLPPLLAMATELPVNWQGLPEPYATSSAVNPARVVARPEGATLKVPDGFTVEPWAQGLPGARYMIQGPGGEVLISQMDEGRVTALRDGKAATLLDGLHGPYGLALHGEWLYVAEVTSVKRYPYDAAQLRVGPGAEVIDLGDYDGGHSTRTIVFDAAHEKLYLSVGSASNVDAGEPPLRATISRHDPDGRNGEIFASGLRNAVGLGFNPVTGELWATAHERDGLGDDLVPDYLTRVVKGGFYGWPYAYIGPHEDPRRKGEAPDQVRKTLYPTVLLGGHVGALDLLFYTGNQFPERYRNGCFVALHGSWNRSRRAGYKVAFVPFVDGRPQSGPEDFLTGWMLGEDDRRVWGRPVGLLQLPDGSLLVSDDGAGMVWRISYTSEMR